MQFPFFLDIYSLQAIQIVHCNVKFSILIDPDVQEDKKCTLCRIVLSKEDSLESDSAQARNSFVSCLSFCTIFGLLPPFKYLASLLRYSGLSPARTIKE